MFNLINQILNVGGVPMLTPDQQNLVAGLIIFGIYQYFIWKQAYEYDTRPLETKESNKDFQPNSTDSKKVETLEQTKSLGTPNDQIDNDL